MKRSCKLLKMMYDGKGVGKMDVVERVVLKEKGQGTVGGRQGRYQKRLWGK